MRMRLVCLLVLAASAAALFPAAPAAAETQAALQERLQERKTLGIDWFRAGFLGGVANLVGFRLTAIQFKFQGAYVDALQGGLMFPGSDRFRSAIYAFGGTEAGWLWVRGPHYVAIGTLIQFAMVNPGAISGCEPKRPDLLEGNLGLGVGPALRYRYYVEEVGFEVSMEWPIVIGIRGVTTVWPIFGVSIGM